MFFGVRASAADTEKHCRCSATFYDRAEKKIMVGAVGVCGKGQHREPMLYITCSKCVQRGIQLNLVVCILQAKKKKQCVAKA